MQHYDETIQDESATSLIFVDKLFGQTCKYEGLPEDKKATKIWMKDVVAKLTAPANTTNETVTEEEEGQATTSEESVAEEVSTETEFKG